MTENEIRNQVLAYQYQKKQLQTDIDNLQTDINNLQTDIELLDKTLLYIAEMMQAEQEKFKLKFESLTSLCLQSVYGDNISFRFDTDIKRGKSEYVPIISIDNTDFDPRTECGSGVMNVIGFALRISVWSVNPTAPVFILDEPFNYLGQSLQGFSEMLEQISEEMEIQFIIVSHNQELVGISNKTFNILKEGNDSWIE